MTYRVKILPSAYTDMREAKKWYSEINKDLAIDFKEQVNSEIDHISLNPEHYQKRYKQFRLSHLKRFPYSIFYIVDQKRKQIVIVGVLHMKRDPEHVTKREV